MTSPYLSPKAEREALTEALFLVPPRPDLFQSPGVPGIAGYIGPQSPVYYSLIRIGRPLGSPGELDGLIQDVYRRFDSLGKGWRWLVGPTDEAGNLLLAKKLEQAGMHLRLDFAGMVTSDLSRATTIEPGVEVREVGAAEIANHIHLITESHKISLAQAEWALFRYSPDRRDLRARCYIATVDGHAAAYGFMLYIPKRRVANLRMAGTLPAFRHRGAYRSLVARRLADARADGMQAANVTALRDTSFTILQRLGFATVCDYLVYAQEAR